MMKITAFTKQQFIFVTKAALPAVALAVICYLSLWIFIARGNIVLDHDSGNSFNRINAMATRPFPYSVDRRPGSPGYELPMAFLAKISYSFGASPEHVRKIILWTNWGGGFVVLLLLFNILKKRLGPMVAFVATMAMAVHPLYIWHSRALVEDVFSLFCVFVGWWLLRYEDEPDLAALLMAVGTAAKTFGLAYGVAGILYVSYLNGPKKGLRFALLFALSYFMLMLPSLAAVGMDVGALFTTNHYGTSPASRPAIGWLMARDTFLYLIPMVVILGGAYGLRFLRRDFRLILRADIWLILFFPFMLMDYKNYTIYRIFLILVALTLLIPFVKKMIQDKTDKNRIDFICYAVMALMVFFAAFRAPYSRSYFLLALPPLILVLSYRFKSLYFWLMVVVVSYMPMFNYFDFRAKPPFVRVFPDGFYSAHLEENREQDYHSFGFTYSGKEIWKFPS